MEKISISTFEPQMVVFDLIANDRSLRVQTSGALLKEALHLNDADVDLVAALEQHLDAIRDIAWAQYIKTNSASVQLSRFDLEPLFRWTDRIGPPVVNDIPDRPPVNQVI